MHTLMNGQILDGVAGEILETNGDTLVGLDTRYTNLPDTQWAVTFPLMAGNVLLPLTYPDYTPEVGSGIDILFDIAGCSVACGRC